MLDKFNISFVYNKGAYSFPCPVHGGDNHKGCTIFEGKHGVPTWRCWTRSCHEKYGKNIMGFSIGALSHSYGREVTYQEAVKFLGGKISAPIQEKKTVFDKLTSLYAQEEIIVKNVDRDYIRSNLIIPSPYFVGRSYNPDVLDEFDVGDSYQEGKMMYQRAVCPVYDENYMYAGCAGRTIVGHEDKWIYGFSKGNFLYGLNKAKSAILKSECVNIVEGMGDFWKIWSLGFHNSLAIMGACITEEQIKILERTGALMLNILTDNDAAGRKVAESIIEQCGKKFNYRVPNYSGKDPGECSDQELETKCIK